MPACYRNGWSPGVMLYINIFYLNEYSKDRPFVFIFQTRTIKMNTIYIKTYFTPQDGREN